MTVRLGAFFAGIGGIELGSEMAFSACGYKAETVFQIENNPFSQKVLARHWPKAVRFSDIKTVDPRKLPRYDLATIGFPCTDLSTAGKQAGIHAERSGLWFVARDILAATRPPTLIIENINQGRQGWLPYVVRDLQAQGYRTFPYRVAASDLGAPHQRARAFVVATHTDRKLLRHLAERMPRRRTGMLRRPWQAESANDGAAWFARVARGFASPPSIRRVDDGLSRRMDTRSVNGAGDRSDSDERNKALGNAVSPPVAYAVALELIRILEDVVFPEALS